MLDAPDPGYIAYRPGVPLVHRVIRGGALTGGCDAGPLTSPPSTSMCDSDRPRGGRSTGPGTP